MTSKKPVGEHSGLPPVARYAAQREPAPSTLRPRVELPRHIPPQSELPPHTPGVEDSKEENRFISTSHAELDIEDPDDDEDLLPNNP